MNSNRPSVAAEVAIVTSTWNRVQHIQRLHDSLLAQGDIDFTWIVVDDASEDGSWNLLQKIAVDSPFPVKLIRNASNRGKCASLNEAFAAISANFYLIVDSDDSLLPHAIRSVKEKTNSIGGVESIGGVFFSYQSPEGVTLGGPERGADVIATRPEYDERYGKYDGCVGYFRRVVEQYRYPEFPGESYLGPTVLQLAMAPKYTLCFTAERVGIAEYQEGGLTASGRSLRLANPLGMMEYARLQRHHAKGRAKRFKYAVMFHAFRRLSARPRSELNSLGLAFPRECAISMVGFCLAQYWTLRHGSRRRTA